MTQHHNNTSVRYPRGPVQSVENKYNYHPNIPASDSMAAREGHAGGGRGGWSCTALSYRQFSFIQSRSRPRRAAVCLDQPAPNNLKCVRVDPRLFPEVRSCVADSLFTVIHAAHVRNQGGRQAVTMVTTASQGTTSSPRWRGVRTSVRASCA